MRSRIIWLAMVCLGLFGAACVAGENQAPVVSNVTAAQRGDGTNLVDVYYDLAEPDGDTCAVYLSVSSDGGGTWAMPAASVSGDLGAEVAQGTGKHIIWDIGKDAPGIVGNNFRARVTADDKKFLGEMCFVPAGLFKTSTNAWVYMSDYWIDTYEVTNEFYCLFLNSGGKDDYYHTKQSLEIVRVGEPGSYTYILAPGREKCPVRWVAWNDAKAFCDWRSETEGVPGSYHLPTDAQWEKAAIWDPSLQRLWGYAIRSDTVDCSQANCRSCVGTTRQVGYYSGWKSFYGCYDMTGSVWEMCADWYGSTYPTGASDPTGPSSGQERVMRGGSFVDSMYLYAAYRNRTSVSAIYENVGFRCARTAQ